MNDNLKSKFETEKPTAAHSTPEAPREPAVNLDCGGKRERDAAFAGIETNAPDHSQAPFLSKHPVSSISTESSPTAPPSLAADHQPSARQRLIQILESYGVPIHGFDALRSDAYERHLAGRSLKELDLFYGRLLNPSEPYEMIRERCRRWGQGSKHKGKLPSVKTLTNIRERIRLDGMLERAACTPEVKNAATINAVQAYVLADLMGVVEEGKRMIDHLPAVDRVIRTVNSRTRIEQGQKMAEIAGKLAELKGQKLELKREQDEWVRGGKKIVTPPPAEAENTRDSEVESAKAQAMAERNYRINPNQLEATGMIPGTDAKVSNFNIQAPENVQKPNSSGKNNQAAENAREKAETSDAPGIQPPPSCIPHQVPRNQRLEASMRTGISSHQSLHREIRVHSRNSRKTFLTSTLQPI